MTALTDREIRMARAVHKATREMRAEVERLDGWMLDCPPGEFPPPDIEAEAEEIWADVEHNVALLAEIGVSINAPFALPPLPADYWVGNA